MKKWTYLTGTAALVAASIWVGSSASASPSAAVAVTGAQGPATIDVRYSPTGPTLRTLPRDPLGNVPPLLTATVPTGNWQITAVAHIEWRGLSADEVSNLECDLDNNGIVIGRQQWNAVGLVSSESEPVIAVAKIPAATATLDLRCYATSLPGDGRNGLVIPYATRMIITRVGTISPVINP